MDASHEKYFVHVQRVCSRLLLRGEEPGDKASA